MYDVNLYAAEACGFASNFLQSVASCHLNWILLRALSGMVIEVQPSSAFNKGNSEDRNGAFRHELA